MAESLLSSRSFCFFFHLLSFLYFLYVFSWHFGSEAAHLEQSKGFGWFFKYLTFCGFTLQMVSLLVSFFSDCFCKDVQLWNFADALSCMSFTIANVITVMFWSLLFIIEKPVDQHVQHGKRKLPFPPLQISLSVHLGNSLVAWIDIISARHSFNRSSFIGSLTFGILYCMGVEICRIMNKEYPYPFLNDMPQPEGFLGIAIIGASLLSLFYWVGFKITCLVHDKGRWKSNKID